MERRLLRPAHSYKVLREDCGFAMEDWTSFHERVQNALLEPRNYVALQKPHLHREAWEEWLQKLLDTGLAEVYWSVKSSKKWNVVENGEVIRAFIRDVVIALGSEISRARNRIAREMNYVKNIEPAECPASTRSPMDDSEASTLYHIKVEAPWMAPGTAEKRPLPGSVIMARKLEWVPSVSNNVPPMPAPPPPLPLASLPFLPPSEPPLKLLPVREVVDIERYDPDAPIELIPEGYVKQYVIDDNDDGHINIVLLEDPSYSSYRPKKRLATGRLDTPNQLLRDNAPQPEPVQKNNSSPAPSTPTPHPLRGSSAQVDQVLIPEKIPGFTPYSLSHEATPAPTERKHSEVAESDTDTGGREGGIKYGIQSDDGKERDEDYRGDDEDEAGYAGRGGTGTDTEEEREPVSHIPRGKSGRHKSSALRTRYSRRGTRLRAS